MEKEARSQSRDHELQAVYRIVGGFIWTMGYILDLLCIHNA